MPIRQWVLSVPYRLRYLLAWDHDLCRGVAGLLARAVFRVVRERAREAGVEGADGGLRWAALMARTFGLDVPACPRCGGRLRLVALIDRAGVVARILRHLGVPVETPPPRPARAPPLVPDGPAQADWEGDPSAFVPCS